MDKDLRVDGCLEYGTLALEAASKQCGIGEVTVMCQCQCTARIVDAQRLCIRRKAEPRRRIAHMADGNFGMVKMRQFRAKHLSHQPHPFFDVNPRTVRQRNTRTLLPAMLERKEAEIGHLGHILRRRIHAVDAALFLPLWQFLVHRSYASPVSLWSISL